MKTRARSGGDRWVLLIHQIPPKPDYFRVKIGRRLQRLGAVAIKNSVYVLPRKDDTVEDFQWQRQGIVAEGGEASVCEASFVDGLSDAAIEALFRKAREADYREITQAARHLLASRNGRTPVELDRLKRRLAEVAAIDFFGAPHRRTAYAAIRRLETKVSPKRKATRVSAGQAVPRPRAATWVTRKDVHVDRIASAWLIRRFVDPGARFKFVAPKGYRPLARELRFDMFEAEYTHDGEACTFETLTKRFDLRDSALRIIGEIVHDIDYKEPTFGRSETGGVDRMVKGIARQHARDAARLTHGAALFDALYEALRHGSPPATG